MSNSIVDVLRYSGPIALDELSFRMQEDARVLAEDLERLKSQGVVRVVGRFASSDLTRLKADEIERDDATTVELSSSTLVRLTR